MGALASHRIGADVERVWSRSCKQASAGAERVRLLHALTARGKCVKRYADTVRALAYGTIWESVDLLYGFYRIYRRG